MNDTKNIPLNGVTYLDANSPYLDIKSPDLSGFVKHPENIPTKVGRPFLQQIRKHIEELFDIRPKDSFATFGKPPNFLWYSLKNLFVKSVAPGIDIDDSIRSIDRLKIAKSSYDDDEKKVETVLEMLYSLMHLNSLLKDIRTSMAKIKKG